MHGRLRVARAGSRVICFEELGLVMVGEAHAEGGKPFTVHRTPYTVHRTPYTQHPTPYTLHRTPYTQHPTDVWHVLGAGSFVSRSLGYRVASLIKNYPPPP